MRYLFLILLIPGMALARPVTIVYQDLSLVTCEGDTVVLANYMAIEFYIDDVSIPAADAGCASDTVPEDTMPGGVTPLPGNLGGANEVKTNLPPGAYFIRMRVFIPLPAGMFCEPGFPQCEWSNLSNQIQRNVPPGSPKVPFLIRVDLG